MRKTLPFFFFFCAFFFAWELFLFYHPTWRGIFPSPTRVIVRLYTGWDRFFLHSMATVNKIIGGIAISLLVAFPLAWWMIQSSTVRMWIQPLIVLMQGLPMFAIAPLMVILFDWSYTAVVIPTALMIFFPLTVSIYRGFASTPPALLDYFRIHQATSSQVLFHLRLPWAMPHICSGLRICGAIAAMSAFTGEWAGAQEGLGVLMMESRRGADLETAFAALFCLSAISMTLYGCMAGFESWVLARRTSSSKRQQGVFFTLKRLTASTATLIFISLLAGCNSPTQERPFRLMLDWNPNPNHIPLYAGIAKGFFNEAGVPIEILKLNDPADTFPYLTSGQADVGINYMCHYLRSYHFNKNLIPIGYLIKEPLNCLLYPTSLGVKSIQDLDGKTFGHASDDLLGKSLSALLRNHKISPGATRKVGFNLIAALSSEKVDVLYGVYSNIESEQLRAIGLETDSMTMTELGMPRYFELIFLTSRDSVFAKKSKVKAFQKALQRSIDFAKEFPEEAFDLYIAANPDKSYFARDWEKQSWARTIPLLAQNQNDEFDVWQLFIKWLQDTKLAPTEISIKELFPKDNPSSIALQTKE